MIVSGMVFWALALGAPAGEKTDADIISISMVAVEARTDPADARKTPGKDEKKTFDRGIEGPARTALSKLPSYTSFRKISSGKGKAPLHKEISFIINDTYTLFATPVSKEENGRILTNVRIVERRSGKPQTERNALSTTMRAVPGDTVLIAGLKLKDGDLVIALTLNN